MLAYVDQLGVPLERGRALDFGCAIGRLTQALGGHFEEAVGVDIAEAMVQQARVRMYERQPREHVEHRDHPARVLALSDGVSAIILTLLVLEIRVPDLARGQSLAEAMREVRPSFVAFLISFVAVAIAWAGHHDLFAMIRRTNRPLIWLNFVYLLPLCLLPFGAALVSRHQSDPVALTLYGTLLVAVTLTRLAIWQYATRRPHLLVSPIHPRSRWVGSAVLVVPGLVAALAVAVAGRSPQASLTIYAVGPLVYFVASAIARSTGPTESAEPDFS